MGSGATGHAHPAGWTRVEYMWSASWSCQLGSLGLFLLASFPERELAGGKTSLWSWRGTSIHPGPRSALHSGRESDRSLQGKERSA